ncbi:MAG: MoaD/ThiS family protein [Desulfobacterales bacterium]|nr:MoaD/ThiS family protein [Desulfobacterales bacterium]
MVQIELKLFVTLAGYLPENAGNHEVKEGQTIDDLIQSLGIPQGLVKLIFVNGKKQDRNYVLQDGDRLGLFPPVGGG